MWKEDYLNAKSKKIWVEEGCLSSAGAVPVVEQHLLSTMHLRQSTAKSPELVLVALDQREACGS